jgi:DNA-binding CsgD family transcriptional regulator
MAITPLELDPSQRPDIGFRPAIMEPMLQAAEANQDLVPPLKRIVQRLGFASFMYGLSTAILPRRDSQIYCFATLPREWILLYERENYIEIDPRITLAAKHSAPVPWDKAIALQNSPPRHHPKILKFLGDAASYGIRSGIAWGVRNPQHHGVIIVLNSPEPTFGPAQRQQLAANIGDILTFATYFHEFFVRNFVNTGMPSRLRGAALTEREIRILEFVARGLTAGDIALKLDITARTVRFHVDSARTKMGALNREEAIALVAKAGLIGIVP